MRILALFILLFCFWASPAAVSITVASDGSGKFTSIQKAIESLPVNSTEDRIILIKNGIYKEKIFIDRHHLIIRGESIPVFGLNKEKFESSINSNSVIIISSISRDEWRCENIDDWGAAVVNVRAKDIKLENITVINDFGYKLKQEYSINCTAGGNKEIKKDGHQFALRCMPTTQRVEVIHCNFYSRGGDTVSPWDVDQGSFYFADCTMEGGVDFYCPRGWAYAERCHFICYNLHAAIWHDGTTHEDSKSVLKNCSFEGARGFKLGRYHRPAQMFILDTKFSEDMADATIYPVFKDSTIKWGHRIYYFNTHRKPKDFKWHKNNISKKLAKQINRDWTLGRAWNMDYPVVNNAVIDSAAERILLAQTFIGGWPKVLVGKQPINYNESWTPEYVSTALRQRWNNEATIDNQATTREIKYLAIAYQKTNNESYKISIEKGIKYLLKMQYANGGFPQYYPDTQGYYKYITFNDGATIHVMEVFKEIVDGSPMFSHLSEETKKAVQSAYFKGLECILNTQLIFNGKKSIWAAQYHHETLLPAKARAYEHASYASAESVGVIQFLMKIKNPSPEIKDAIHGAISFLDRLKITDMQVLAAPSSLGHEMLKEKSPGAPLWSRFYELNSLKPVFSGRDGIIKYKLAEVEAERRDKYKWYGDWPVTLYDKYILWNKKWVTPSMDGITGSRDSSYRIETAWNDVQKVHPQVTFPILNLKIRIKESLNVMYTSYSNRSLSLNVIEPLNTKVKNKKSIMIIHGGGWRTGNKDMHNDLARSLANAGYTCFLPEYRLSTEALYPAAVIDLMNAIQWIKNYAKTSELDTAGLTIMGFSAGAMLASLIGQKPNVNQFYSDTSVYSSLSMVSSLVNMDGILAFIHTESGEGDDTKRTSAATHWFGYNKLQRPDIWKEGSALTHAGAQSPPTLFLNSSVARMHAGRSDYLNILNKHNIYNEVHEFEGAPHSFVFFQPWYDPMVSKILQFLDHVYSK